MTYFLVRESFISGCCCVEGLPLNEAKILGIGRDNKPQDELISVQNLVNGEKT